MDSKMNTTFLADRERAVTLGRPRACLYDASEQQNHFCHHGHICVYRGRLYAMWSNGREGEGEIGQQVCYAVSDDGLRWSAPEILLCDVAGSDTVMTLVPAGWLAAEEQLVAYVGAFEYAFPKRKQRDASGSFRYGVKNVGTRLLAMTSADGGTWSPPQDLAVPICPNLGPQPLQSGRLLITGNWAHAYSDDPAGLSGWKMTGCCTDPACMTDPVRDDPFAHHIVSLSMGYPGSLCEGAFLQTDDGVLHMLHRSNTRWLYESQSHDEGATWSEPERTQFTDSGTKFFLGRLPDGRFYYLGNPVPASNRCPLVLSLSMDGLTFDRHFVLEDKPVPRKYPGVFKNGMYAYPHAVVHEGSMYVIYSLWKEDVFVQKIPLELL